MNLTMDEVTSLPLLEKATVYRSKGTTTPIVEWVSVIESPVEQFVRPHELVLTTAIGCGHDEHLFAEFVQEVINSGAAGLAVATGTFIKSIPDEVIRKVKEKEEDFILIELDWHVRFSDIIKQCLRLLDEKKRHYYKRIEHIQETLLDFVLRRKSIQDVCQYVSDTLVAPVVISDNRGRIRGQCNLVENPLLYHIEQVLYGRLEASGLIYHQLDSLEWFMYEANHALMLEVSSNDMTQGYLIVGGFGIEPFTEEEKTEWIRLLKHVTTAIALFFLHEQAVKETEWLLRDDYVWELAKGTKQSEESLQSRAKSLGYRLNLPYVSLVASLEHLKLFFEQNSVHTDRFDHWLHQQIRQIEDEAEEIARKQTLKSMITFQANELIIFLEVLHDQPIETANRYIDALEARLMFLYPTIQCRWGISKQCGYHVFFETFQEAKKALSIGKRRNEGSHRHLFADTKIDRMIEAIVQVEELNELATQLLETLIHYSKERNIDLLHTFMTYHRHKGNVSQTARTLNLHRQSLLYRLRKIEALTGCSLDNADDLFLLDLSTRIWSTKSNE
ncbi:PucR family transcriptional regulator [Bacillus sp. FJAT-45037]|uniref:PucR family transcriptional regulator n=1 Tax=Bacillus sp. FJAT-45037 TaxID=2011007 RepID=UPI000C24048A|nr:PucR family transcriptional regulator [Bacillus sp. FJAT-45037]